MRILVWFWGRRGAGAQYTYQLCKELARRTDVELGVSLAAANPYAGDTAAFAETAFVEDVHRPFALAKVALRPGARLAAQVSQFRADIVVHPMVGPLTIPMWRRFDVPIVTVIHDAQPHPGDRRAMADAASRFAQRKSAALIAPTESVAALLRATTALPVGVFPFGPLIEGNASDLRWDSKGPIVLAGRLLRYKGLGLLAEAWGMIPTHERCELVVAGEPADDPAVRRSIAALQAVGATIRLGWLDDARLLATIRSARALVLPYIEASQSGLVPIAHANGIPVIGSNVGGLPEQIEDPLWVFEPHSAALAKRLKTLIREPDLLQQRHEYLRLNRSDAWRDLGDELVPWLSQLVDRHGLVG